MRNKSKLTFTTAGNQAFLPGVIGLVKSIRRFYSPEQADIFVLMDVITEPIVKIAKKFKVTLASMRAIQGWSLPTTRGMKFNFLNQAKVFATAYCLIEKEMEKVFYIDSDAFLLAPIDSLLQAHWEPNTIIAWNDKNGNGLTVEAMKRIFRFQTPDSYDRKEYGFNAGIMLYGNGPGVWRYVWDYTRDVCDRRILGACPEQGVCRANVAKHHLLGHTNFKLLPMGSAINWNPIWGDADALTFDAGCWINEKNKKQQIIFHATGGKNRQTGRNKPWQTPKFWSPSTIEAWNWVNSFEGEDNANNRHSKSQMDQAGNVVPRRARVSATRR